jgi:hypothetical protein
VIVATVWLRLDVPKIVSRNRSVSIRSVHDNILDPERATIAATAEVAAAATATAAPPGIAVCSKNQLSPIRDVQSCASNRIAIWLNGYFHGKRGDLMVDSQDLAGNTDKVQEYWIKNPDVLLMPAVETLFGSRN